MPRKAYDPLSFIPSAEAIRGKLRETVAQAERLRLLLDLAEQLELPLTTGESLTASPSNSVKPTTAVTPLQPRHALTRPRTPARETPRAGP